MPQADSRSTIPILRLPKALPRETRQTVELAIKQHIAATEALIAFLDQVDGDPDLECSLSGGGPCTAQSVDLEGDDADLEAGGDDEPSLAHTLDLNQERAERRLRTLHRAEMAIPQDADLEAEHDGREPDPDQEGCEEREE